MAEGGAPGLRGEEADGVLLIWLEGGATNALTAPVRAGLIEALARPGPRALVIAGAGRGFSGGVSIDAGDGAPTLAALCRAVEDSPRPVVAALHGAVAGPGLELALAAHARVAASGARLSLPEIALGLVPQAGASQRLPRLVGAEESLKMLLAGRGVGALEALAMGLVDHVVELPDASPLAAARAEARRLAEAGPPRRTADRREGMGHPATYQAAVAAARARIATSRQPAPEAIVACIEAAQILPFEAGLAFEAARREDLLAAPETQGLAAAARAERRAMALPPALARAAPPPVAHLGLFGSGATVALLALGALAQGLRVTVVEPDRAALAQTLQAIALRQEAEVTAGRLTPAARDADWARLGSGADARVLSAAGLVIARSPRTPEGAELAALLAGVPLVILGGADGVMGLSVAATARASELALPDGVAPLAAATAVALLRRVNLPPVLVAGRPVVGARVVAAGEAAIRRLAAMGVPGAAIAAAIEGFGQALPPPPPPGREPPPRPMPAREIVHRWTGAMAAEGGRLLGMGIARRPCDIDRILVAGHGYPRWRGGPMFQADLRGLMVLRADLRRWGAEDPVWSPPPLFDRLLAEGRRLPDLDG